MAKKHEATISVPADIAAKFNAADPKERKKILNRLRLALSEPDNEDLRALFSAMDAMGAASATQGLTPDVLDDLLGKK
jgi:tellurite resistance protein